MNGTIIGNYQIVGELGSGGMGTVYKAVDLMLEREVALKVLRPELAGRPELVARFRSEAVVLGRLNHPHIATLHGLGREGDRLFMVMEYVRGETLAQLLRRRGPCAPALAARWCAQALDAMAYAHRQQVVHRDIKPANLMLTEDGSIKVMDFGIARLLGNTRQTGHGEVVGTIAYMAPEQVRGGEVDGRADLYSLGIVLHQLLTGRVPFEGPDAFAVMSAHVTRRPDPISTAMPGVPGWIDAAVSRALEKAPDERFQTATEFRRVLETGLRSLPEEDEPTVIGWARALEATSVAAPPGEGSRLEAVPATTGVVARVRGAAGWRRAAAPAAAILVLLGLPATWQALRNPAPAGVPEPLPLAGEAQAPGTTASASPPTEAITGPGRSPAASPGATRDDEEARRAAPPKPPATPSRDEPEEIPLAPLAASSEPGASETVATPPSAVGASRPALPPPDAVLRPAPEHSLFEVELMLDDSRRRGVSMHLLADHLMLSSPDGAVRQSVPYASLVRVAYSEKWPGPPPSGGRLKRALGWKGLFSDSRSHWLTLESTDGLLVIHLGRGYREVLRDLERFSGRTVKTEQAR